MLDRAEGWPLLKLHCNLEVLPQLRNVLNNCALWHWSRLFIMRKVLKVSQNCLCRFEANSSDGKGSIRGAD
jgi:hypothetical protein